MLDQDLVIEIAENLGIPSNGDFLDTAYKVILGGGIDEFGTIHSLLNKSDLVDVDESVVTAEETRVEYEYLEADYIIVLRANLETNEAFIEIKENK